MISLNTFFRSRLALQTQAWSRFRHYSKGCDSAAATPAKANSAGTSKGIEIDELDELLSKPTWSVESLLPSETRAPDAPQITSQLLHHLLRLSALPPPATQEEEQKMLKTLTDQLHFISKIQEIDTTGVAPLRAIRDETKAAVEEQKITLDTLKDALAQEKVIGIHHKRIQRDSTPVDAKEVEDWNVLGSAKRTFGKYFVVESERPPE